jgi:hypothetical protein
MNPTVSFELEMQTSFNNDRIAIATKTLEIIVANENFSSFLAVFVYYFRVCIWNHFVNTLISYHPTPS